MKEPSKLGKANLAEGGLEQNSSPQAEFLRVHSTYFRYSDEGLRVGSREGLIQKTV